MNGGASLAVSESVMLATGCAIISSYIVDHPEFRPIGEAMMSIWEAGVNGLKH